MLRANTLRAQSMPNTIICIITVLTVCRRDLSGLAGCVYFRDSTFIETDVKNTISSSPVNAFRRLSRKWKQKYPHVIGTRVARTVVEVYPMKWK